MRTLGIGYRAGAALISAILLMLNLRLYAPPSSTYGPDQLGADVVPQLEFIGTTLRAGVGEQMQGVFPEGFFFTHVLYGLSWVEVGLRVPAGTSLHARAWQESNWALARLDSEEARSPFDSSLDPPYGVFYAGWSSWLRGGVLMLEPAGQRPADVVARFEADCAALAHAFDASPSPFLSAYPGQAWPVDSVVAVATLRLHDTLLPPRFGVTVDHWVRAAQQHFDPKTGLLPHRVDPLTGQTLEGSRGSSQSLIARFLPEVNPMLGQTQYAMFRQQFVRPFLGAPGVREYPVGTLGHGDVDSGPLVDGFSASATVVMIGAAQVHGDREVADTLIRASEAVGLPLQWGGAKRYLFGILPVGDAFLVWAKTSRPWLVPWSAAALPHIVQWWWRWPLHGVALLLVAFMWLPIWSVHLRKRLA